MKKNYLLVLSFFSVSALMGQFQNMSFETWTSGFPNNWTNLGWVSGSGGTTSHTPVEQISTAASDGTHYLRLNSFTISGSGMDDGTYSSIVRQQSTPTSSRYESFDVDVKYSIQPGDVGLIVFWAYASGGGLAGQNLVGEGYLTLDGSSGTWSTETVDITYFNSKSVVRWEIYATSSARGSGNPTFGSIPGGGGPTPNPVAGSRLDVDKIVAVNQLPPYVTSITNVVTADIGNNNNGNDLWLSFEPNLFAGNDVEEYHLLVLRSDVNVHEIDDLPNYVQTHASKITPSGENPTFIFPTNAAYHYKDGSSMLNSPVVNDVALKVLIYAEAKNSLTHSDYWVVSDNITLSSAVASVPSLVLDEVKLYPNPANDVVNIDFGGRQVDEVSVFSLTGQKITSIKTNSKEQANLNTANLQNGVYIYRLSDAQGGVIHQDKLLINK